MHTLLQILPFYIAINLFISGYHLGYRVRLASPGKEVKEAILLALFIMAFGVLFFSVIFIFAMIMKPLNWIRKTFQITFYFLFYTTTKFSDLDEGKLALMNRIATNRRNTNSIGDRIYRHGLRLINERNNYTYHGND